MGKKRGYTPEEGEKRKIDKEGFSKLRGIFTYMLPYKWSFIGGMLCLLVSSLVLLTIPLLSGKLLNIAVDTQEDLTQIGVLLLVVLVVQAVFSYLRVQLFTVVSENSMARLRTDLFERFMSLPMVFFDERRAGELLSRITTDVETLQATYSTTLAEVIRQFLTLIFGTVFLFILTPKLTLIMISTFPVMIIIAIIFGRFIRKVSRKKQDILADSNVIVEEALHSIQVIKAFTSEIFEINRFKNKQQEVVKVGMINGRYRAAFISFIIFALFGGIMGLIYFGAIMVQNGEMETGYLFSFIIYTMLIGGSVAGLGDLMGQVQRAVGASERVLDIINMSPEFDPEEQSREENLKIEGQINFERVKFRYPTRPDVEVLSDISLNINPGEKVALVGHSGAGKSTIIQLLQRFYDINDGVILVDGIDISTFPVWKYRKHFGLVPQEVILFGGTIRENIGYGKPGATDEEIRNAAAEANALDFIENFPEGLDTLVGDRGVKLSGGQRQRIAIARAILKNPTILILDEATSSLDAESEAQVQGALDELMKGRTTIIIAHRLATIRKVDRIYVLDQGRIIESGTHDQLLGSEKGIYSNLVKLQLQEN